MKGKKMISGLSQKRSIWWGKPFLDNSNAFWSLEANGMMLKSQIFVGDLEKKKKNP